MFEPSFLHSDAMSHFETTCLLASFAYFFFLVWIKTCHLSAVAIGLLAMLCAFSSGAFWEVLQLQYFEYYSILRIEYAMDTMKDLRADLLGSVAGSVFMYLISLLEKKYYAKR